MPWVPVPPSCWDLATSSPAARNWVSSWSQHEAWAGVMGAKREQVGGLWRRWYNEHGEEGNTELGNEQGWGVSEQEKGQGEQKATKKVARIPGNCNLFFVQDGLNWRCSGCVAENGCTQQMQQTLAVGLWGPKAEGNPWGRQQMPAGRGGGRGLEQVTGQRECGTRDC